MNLFVFMPCSAYNLVVSVDSLSGFWTVFTMPGPSPAGVTLLGTPAAKSGIPVEAGGVYTGNQVKLYCLRSLFQDYLWLWVVVSVVVMEDRK